MNSPGERCPSEHGGQVSIKWWKPRRALKFPPPSETLARLSFQRFFRFFHKLAGLTGTAKEASDELWHIYKRPVVRIPENKPCLRIVLPQSIYPDRESKWSAIVEEIKIIHQQGRPILIGTRSVKSSQELAARLDECGMVYRILNALNHEEEAGIVAEAGTKRNITVATNMAGRGTDIILEKGASILGGLHVIATECHESPRIDRQLFGRSSRQGDPGSAHSFVSLEDELLIRFLPSNLRKSIKISLIKKLPGSGFMAKQAVRWAQKISGRRAYQARRSILKIDTWLDDSLSFSPSNT